MKRNYTVKVEADKIYRQKLIFKIAKITFLFLLIILSVIYFLLYVVYSKGNFVVSLDKNIDNRKNIFLSEDGNLQNMKVELRAKSLDYMDNISIDWINKDVDTEATGSHNGQNYIAYTFYIMNAGDETVDYWYQIDIEDTIKDVDEAIRIMIFHNGEKMVYGKKNKTTGLAEVGTKMFYSDSIAVLENVKQFAPGGKDRFTVVIWLEGDDPDCLDNLIGGEIKLKMNMTEEHINGNKK